MRLLHANRYNMKTIETFMLECIAGLVGCYIEENNYNGWETEVINDGLKLINKTTKQYATWNVYDYDCDFKVIQNKIIKFLKLQNNH